MRNIHYNFFSKKAIENFLEEFMIITPIQYSNYGPYWKRCASSPKFLWLLTVRSR